MSDVQLENIQIDEEKPHHGTNIVEILAAVIVTLAAFSVGTYLSWSSPALPLYNKNGTLSVNEEEGSWIGSLVPLGALPGAIPAGMFADKFGRKRTILVITLPLFLCWFLIAFAPDVRVIYVARFLGGVMSGAATVIVPVYISEIAEAEIRGSLGTLFQLQITLGILFTYMTGFSGNLKTISILCSVAPLLLLILFPFMPESPTWLIAQRKTEESQSALRKLRGKHYQAEYVLTQLERSCNLRAEKVSLTELLHYKKSMTITLGLMVFQQLSGINTVIFYGESIFIAAGSSMSSTLCSVVIGLVQVLATYISTIVIERTGRKILLLISSSVMSLSLMVLASYFQFRGSYLENYSWLPMLSLTTFIIVFSIGFGPIPWLMVGEIFPNNVRGVASSATATCNWTLAFAVTKVFQSMIDFMGDTWSFITFALIGLVGTVFVAFVVPETKGKTVEQVQSELDGL